MLILRRGRNTGVAVLRVRGEGTRVRLSKNFHFAFDHGDDRCGCLSVHIELRADGADVGSERCSPTPVEYVFRCP